MIGALIVTILLGLFAYCSCVVASEADKWEEEEEQKNESNKKRVK